jgi:NAD(P)-dependent dehydrogenase (short-subunit alcohol dehydrogenase family)
VPGLNPAPSVRVREIPLALRRAGAAASVAMPPWTADQVPDQRGRTAIVTGATGGLGLVTARELARGGADVVLAVRDTERGDAVAERIRADAPGARVRAVRLDLADLGSVRAFVAALRPDDAPLDLLVNNAGVMALPELRTADGFEMQLGTNHLGHFALTGLLLPRLLAAQDARVVTVTSAAHRMGRLAPEDLGHLGEPGGSGRYRRWRAYGGSKLANLLFAFELQRRADVAGVPLLSVAAHPGFAATDLQIAGPRMEGSAARLGIARLATRLFAQSPEAGALPILFAATMPVPGGGFVGPGGPFEARGQPRFVSASRAAGDAAAAARLWEASEELTQVRFAFPAAFSAPG